MKEKTSYNRIGAAEAQALERIMSGLLHAGKPAQSIGQIIERGMNAPETAFEQYAAMLLENAGGSRLASSRYASALKVIQPENGQLAQLVHTGNLSPSLTPTLLAVECALNRLVCIADAISDGISEKDPPHEEPRRSISLLGGGFLGSTAGWRSTRVVLPPLPSTGDITQEYYNEIDWRSTDCVASNARAVFQRSMRPNAYASVEGVRVPSQSDWDVRTRLAQILRALELPHRYSFRFDYDSASHAVSVVFTCPPPSFLPAIMDGTTADERSSAQAHAYEAHLLRLACLFVAACFGGGRAIETAIVAGYNASWRRPIITAEFKRDDYVRSVLMAVDSNVIADSALRFDAHAIARLIVATHLDWLGKSKDSRHGVALPPTDLAARRIEPWEDNRPLPPDAQELFRCTRICDVDTSHYHGGHAGDVDAARRDSDDSSLAAIVRLESLIATLEAETIPPDDDASARPLYAAHATARLAIGLLDDEMNVAAQAEAFLQGNLEAIPAEDTAPRYFRAPDALFHAHYGLSDLYQRLGDFQGAIVQADRCIALAPTTASAYFRKADILTEQGYLTQAANVLICGLQCTTTDADASLLYFHLGMLLWHLDKQYEAIAVHVYNMSLKGEHANRSKKVVEGLRKREDVPAIAEASPFTASRALQDARLPVAPINIRDRIAQATIALANAGSPRAATPYARLYEHHCSNDEIIMAACRSIQQGTAL